MMRGRVNSFPPHGRHINDAFPGLWPLRFRRPPLIRQQQQQCCCYLIYKLPVLWRSGAAARLSRLHTPVETGTPPRRRGKLHYTHSRLAARVRTVPLPLLSTSETLRSRWRLCRLTDAAYPLRVLRWFLIWFRDTFWVLELGSLSRIVTHFYGEMCYDFVTFFIFRFLPV